MKSAFNMTVTIEGEREVLHLMRVFDEESTAGVKLAVHRAALALEAAAKLNVTVDTGRLRASIHHEIDGEGMSATVGTLLEYAAYVEYGTRPHYAPLSALQPWAQHHGIPVGAMWQSIALHGTRPHPFLFPAWVAVSPLYVVWVRKAMDEAKRRAA